MAKFTISAGVDASQDIDTLKMVAGIYYAYDARLYVGWHYERSWAHKIYQRRFLTLIRKSKDI
jgi:hypothetical protein